MAYSDRSSRLNSSVTFNFVLLAILLTGTIAPKLAAASCLTQGGIFECRAPEIQKWSYVVGQYESTSMGEYARWCNVRGGIWQYPASPPCLNDTPFSESNYEAFATAFVQSKWPTCQVSPASAPWQQTGCSPVGCQHTPVTFLGIVSNEWHPLNYQMSGAPGCDFTYEMQA